MSEAQETSVERLDALLREGKIAPEDYDVLRGALETRPEPERRSVELRPGGRLRRSPTERVISGVCGGIAEALGTNPWAVRLVFVLGAVALSPVVVFFAYLVLRVAMPPAEVPSEPGERGRAETRAFAVLVGGWTLLAVVASSFFVPSAAWYYAQMGGRLPDSTLWLLEFQLDGLGHAYGVMAFVIAAGVLVLVHSWMEPGSPVRRAYGRIVAACLVVLTGVYLYVLLGPMLGSAFTGVGGMYGSAFRQLFGA